MTGINQTMMMAVAMVVTCAMIGANGLGMEVLIAINRMESDAALSPVSPLLLLRSLLIV